MVFRVVFGLYILRVSCPELGYYRECDGRYRWSVHIQRGRSKDLYPISCAIRSATQSNHSVPRNICRSSHTSRICVLARRQDSGHTQHVLVWYKLIAIANAAMSLLSGYASTKRIFGYVLDEVAGHRSSGSARFAAALLPTIDSRRLSAPCVRV